MSLPRRIEISADPFFVSPYVLSMESLFHSLASGLSLGLAAHRSYKTSKEFSQLAVYARTEEGSGTLITNEGQAQNGVLQSGTWLQEFNGIYALNNPHVIFEHHPSMHPPIFVYEGNIFRQYQKAYGAVLIRNAIAGQIAYKKGLFKIEVTNGGTALEFTHYAMGDSHYWEIYPENDGFDNHVTITDPDILAKKDPYPVPTPVLGHVSSGMGKEVITYNRPVAFTQTIRMPGNNNLFANIWAVLSWTVLWNGFDVFLNGKSIASIRFTDRRTQDDGYDLELGGSNFIGEMDWMLYSGIAPVTQFLTQLNPASGTYTSTIIDLLALPEFAGLDLVVFERARHNGFGNDEHTLDLTVRMGDDVEFTMPRSVTMDIRKDWQRYGNRCMYYPGDEYVYGRFLQLVVSMNKKEAAQLAPLLKELFLRFRAL